MTKGTGIPKDYKQTKVGVIPEDWGIRKIKDFAIVKTGSTPSTYDQSLYGEKHLFVSPSDLGSVKYISKSSKLLSDKGFSNSRQFSKGSILFICIGSTIGKCGIAGEKLTSNQQINAVLPNKYFSNEFLYYELSYLAPKIKLLAGEQAVPLINKSDFESTFIKFPPLSEQQKIASILSFWDKAIEATQAIIEKLKFRNKGLSQQLLFGKKRLKGFKNSWQDTSLGKCASNINIRNKETHGTENLYAVTKKAGIIPMREQVKGDSFKNCKIVRQNWFAYNPMRINIGSIALWEKPEEIMVSGDYVVFECNPSKLLPHYLEYLRKTVIWESHMLIAGNGSVRIRIYFKDLAHFKFSLPSVKEQEAILEVLDNANKELKLYEKKLASLKEQKKGLMQKLLTGEIRVNTKEKS